jgi:hypothetical protein
MNKPDAAGLHCFPAISEPYKLESATQSLPLVVNGVLTRTHQVQRNIRLASDDPAVVSRRNIENITRIHRDYFAVVHGGSRSP